MPEGSRRPKGSRSRWEVGHQQSLGYTTTRHSQRRLARRNQAVVDERDDAREDGARRRRAADEVRAALVHDRDVVTHGRDVGEGAARGGVPPRVRVAEGGEVGLDSVGLVVGAVEVPGEASAAEVDGGLGNVDGAADRRDAEFRSSMASKNERGTLATY